MSILDNDNNQNRPTVPPAKMAANRLINQARNTYQQMVQAFNQGSRMFWANGMGASSVDIAAELGTDAKEVFELHHKLGLLIASVKPEAISEGASLVGDFTMNEDGTVTVVVPEAPEVPENTPE
jgi:hypothetical protein